MRIFTRVLLAVLAIVVAVACERSTVTTEEESPGPTPTGKFTLVGRADVVTLGATPPLSLPTQSPDEDDDVPDQPGSLRVTLQSFNDELGDECGADRGEVVTVFWLTSTRFDPKKVLDDLRDELDGQRISAQGDIFASTTSTTTTTETTSPVVTTSPAATTTVTTSPAATTATTQTCVLVADHIEVSQGASGGGGGATTSPSETETASPSTTAGSTLPPGIRKSPSPTITP